MRRRLERNRRVGVGLSSRVLERWVGFAQRRPKCVLALTLALTAALASQLPGLRIDTSLESLLHERDPVLLAYEEFRRDFGRDAFALVALRTENVFDPAFLETLRQVHEALEAEVPHVEKVTSLVNARSVRAAGDDLVVEDFLEHWPENERALESLRERALANPLYRDLLVTSDLHYAVLLVDLENYSTPANGADALDFSAEPAESSREPKHLTGEDEREVERAIQRVASRFEGRGLEVLLSGAPIVNSQTSNFIQLDTVRFFSLSVLLLVVALTCLFRRLLAALLPLAIVLLSVVATLSLLPLLDMPFQVPTQILPPLLLAIGVGYSVHILTHYDQHLRHGEAPREALAGAFSATGPALLMMAATTAGGFASFLTSELAPIANLGVVAPIGVLVALVYTVTLLPAALALWQRVRELPPAGRGTRASGRLVARLGGAAAARPVVTLLAGLVVLLAASVFAANLRFSYDVLRWFRAGETVRSDTETLNRDLAGGFSLEVVFDTGRENGVHDPRFLAALERVHEHNARLQGDLTIGKSTSIVDIVKEIHQALHENRPEFYALPDEERAVAQELFLFESAGSDDLQDFVDWEFSKARMTLRIPFTDAIRYVPLIESLESNYRRIVGPDVEVTITGRAAVVARTFSSLTRSMATSYLVALAVISALMMLALRSVTWGIASMIPNVAPVLLTLGVMGAFGVPLDAFTLLIGSIAIGLAVDDTIHVLHGFGSARAAGAGRAEAIRSTLATTGEAIFYTSVILCGVFLLFTTGRMQSTFHFGVLTSFALVTALAADVLLLPALLALLPSRKAADRSRGTMQARATANPPS